MQIRVLGPVDVVDDDGNNVQIGGPTQSRVLAMLVAAQPGAASVDDLVDGLWAGELPDDPVGTIRTYIARLRRSLGPETIVTEAGAYRLAETPTDAVRFVELVDRARRSSGSPTVAEVWQRALDLWRGPAFGDHADLEIVGSEAARLEELRAEATEACFDARLAAGEGRELVADLEAAVEAFPLREGFRAQQMTVLARAGRAPEALRAFQDFRGDLTDVGLEPSARLVELDREISAGKVPRSGARRTLRGYELGERLGEGAFAVVHQATQASVGRHVAIKQIRGSLADQPEFIRQFEAEAHLVARLEHPHIVPLYDFWREPGSAYLVMRYLDGGSLGTRLLDGPLSLDVTVGVTGQVAAALDAAHAANIVHRDVKPGNILLDAAGNAYLGDFGIAVEEAERLDPEAWLSNGSPAYAPPEQLERKAVGPTADVYALAMTAYESLTGELPFAGETTMAGLTARQLNDPIPLARVRVPDLPAAVDTVLQRATAKQPADRYQTAGAFALDLAAAAGLEGDEALVQPAERNPYKGLQAFTEADAADFAGRSRLVQALLHAVSQERIVMVVGPSGSGKSSVVRAGLLPALRTGGVTGSERWFVTSMTPGADPFASMEAALLQVAADPPSDLVGTLRSGSTGLAKIIRQIIPTGREVVLVIDQFEELFTLADESEAVLDALVDALSREEPRFRVVATLRADFYDHPLSHPAFAESIGEATIPVHPLAADELERAITEPARAVGASFEAGLVAEITADIADQPGALPLLQYALTELFDQREGQTLTRANYQAIGGVTGALARRAEQLYLALPEEASAEARPIFGRLVSLGEGTEDTRRRSLRSEFGDRPGVDIVIERFGKARLLAFDRDAATREPTVEVGHEALIREWPRYRTWIKEDREGLRVLHHLRTASDEWDKADRPESELYQGGRLEAAESWAGAHQSELTSTELEFVNRSVARREAETEAEARNNRRLRRLLVGVALVAVMAVIAGSIAFIQRNDANEARAEAEGARDDEAVARADAEDARDDEAEARLDATMNAELADTRRLVSDAATLVEDNADLALLLAAEADRRADTPQTAAGLQGVLTQTRGYLGTIGHGRPFMDVQWLEDGTIVGVEADTVSFFDHVTHQEIVRHALPAQPTAVLWEYTTATVHSVGDKVAVGTEEGHVVQVTTEGSEVVLQLADPISTIRFSPDGQQLLVGDQSGRISLVEVATGEVVWSTNVIFDRHLADVSSPTSAETYVFLSHNDAWAFGSGPVAAVFEDDQYVSVGAGVHLRRLDRTTGQIVDELLLERDWLDIAPEIPVPTNIRHVARAPNGFLYAAGWHGAIYRVSNDYGSFESIQGPLGQNDGSEDHFGFGLTPSGDIWLAVSNGRIAGGAPFEELADQPLLGIPLANTGALTLSPDGTEMLVSGTGGIVRWSTDGRQLLASPAPRGVANQADVSHDGELLYVGGFAVREFDVYDIGGATPTALEGRSDLGPPTLFGDHDSRYLVGTVPGALEGGLVTYQVYDRVTQENVGVSYALVETAATGFSWDGKQVAAGWVNLPSMRVHDISTGEQVSPTLDLTELSQQESWMGDVEFDPRRPRLVGVLSRGEAAIYSTETWELERAIPVEESGGIVALSYARAADVLVTRGADGSIVVRDPETFEALRTIEGGTSARQARGRGPYISPDGEYLLTARDPIPRLWHLPTGTPLGAFPLDQGTTAGGASGDEQLRLATILGDHALSWNLDVESWAAIACRAAGRNMTLAEWEQFGPAGQDYQVTCPEWPAAAS